MSHYTDKTHFFRDEHDERTVVISTMLPDGSYQADRIEPAWPIVHGYGDTRMAAIADINDNIALEDAR